MSIPNSGQQFEGLKKTYNVVIDVIMTENCWYADMVLPDKTYLESWHYAPTRGTPEAGHNAIRQPMTNPYNLEWDAFGICGRSRSGSISVTSLPRNATRRGG